MRIFKFALMAACLPLAFSSALAQSEDSETPADSVNVKGRTSDLPRFFINASIGLGTARQAEGSSFFQEPTRWSVTALTTSADLGYRAKIGVGHHFVTGLRYSALTAFLRGTLAEGADGMVETFRLADFSSSQMRLSRIGIPLLYELALKAEDESPRIMHTRFGIVPSYLVEGVHYFEENGEGKLRGLEDDLHRWALDLELTFGNTRIRPSGKPNFNRVWEYGFGWQMTPVFDGADSRGLQYRPFYIFGRLGF